MAKRKSPRKTTIISSDLDPVERYARLVLAGEIVAGPYVRQQCQRHLYDLKKGGDRGLVWRPDRAARAINFFADVLRLPESEVDEVTGDDVVIEGTGRPFLLDLSQKFIVGSLFGWYNADGTRRFRIAFIEIGKGNGKSPLAAGIGLYMLMADGQQSAEIYAAAAVKDQAKIQYRDAVLMVDASEDLSKRIIKHGEKEVYNLVNPRSNGFFKAISAEKRGLDGKRVHCALLDELHEHPSPIVADKMRAGTKGMRNALIVEITNSGVDRLSVCYQHHEYAVRVVSGQVVDDAFFAYVCALDEGDDPLTDESCWPKANPLLGVTITARYLRELVVAARGMPAQASIVLRLNFCVWVDAINPWIDGGIWTAAEVPRGTWVPPADVEPVGAIDLGGTKDLTALGLVWPPKADGDPVFAKIEAWTPGDTLHDRAKTDRVPYDVWVSQGHLVATPGRAVDYRFVAVRLGEIQKETGLKRVAFDAYKIKYLEAELDDLGLEFELVPHGQGWQKSKESGLWMPHSIEILEGLLSTGRIKVQKNPALTFASASAVTESDPQENRRFNKRRAKGRIDPLVALAMAAGLAMDRAEPEGDVGMLAM